MESFRVSPFLCVLEIEMANDLGMLPLQAKIVNSLNEKQHQINHFIKSVKFHQ